jgi:inorganic pyrophosphatase/exopolyphosphatase|eukprot:g5939.t1
MAKFTTDQIIQKHLLKLRQSPLARAVRENDDVASSICKDMSSDDIPHEVQTNEFLTGMLKDCVFVGHLNTDLDSVAGAIGAAELYGGTPALAQRVLNTEIEWALQRWGIPKPVYIGDIPNLKNLRICLVDHNQWSQTPKCIDQEQIVGIIDHHATQSGTVQTSSPIFFDIRPWGSMSTILSHNFMRQKRKIKPRVAGIMMSAILSDTLNFKSPTTTDVDKLVVSTLAKVCGVDDIDAYAQQQFKAKSKMVFLFSPAELVRGDQKKFDFKSSDPNWAGSFGWGTLECVDLQPVIERREAILAECAAAKKEQECDFFMFTAVNIVDEASILFCCGKLEAEIAEKAFGGRVTDEGLLDLGKLVSRKKQFIPKTMDVLALADWQPSAAAFEDADNQKSKDHGLLVVDPSKGEDGQIVRIQTSDLQGKGLFEKFDSAVKVRRSASFDFDQSSVLGKPAGLGRGANLYVRTLEGEIKGMKSQMLDMNKKMDLLVQLLTENKRND